MLKRRLSLELYQKKRAPDALALNVALLGSDRSVDALSGDAESLPLAQHHGQPIDLALSSILTPNDL